MASHRKPHPSGTNGTGFRAPALATAALTSVAVLSQTAEPAHAADGGGPSVEEIEKKIDDFYREAESAAERQEAVRERGGRERGGQERGGQERGGGSGAQGSAAGPTPRTRGPRPRRARRTVPRTTSTRAA